MNPKRLTLLLGVLSAVAALSGAAVGLRHTGNPDFVVFSNFLGWAALGGMTTWLTRKWWAPGYYLENNETDNP